jgi:O-antigen/teichoic acid export membrane protein
VKYLVSSYIFPAILINIGNLCAFLFQFVLVRILTPNDFGAFNSLFALVNVLLAPASIVPFVLSRAMILASSSRTDRLGSIVRHSAWAGFAAAGIIIVLGIVVSNMVRSLLQIEHSLAVVFAAALLALSFLHIIAAGWLQGVARYIASACALAAVPVLRLIFGSGLVVFGGGVDGALLGAAAGSLVVFIGGIFSMRHVFRRSNGTPVPTNWQGVGRFALPAAATTLILFAFWNLDLVLVRILFSPHDSGLYALAALLGRVPFLTATALASALFPETIRAVVARDHSAAHKRPLQISLALGGALGFAAAISIAALAEPLLILVGGTAYAVAAPILRVLSFAMAALAMLQIAVTYLMASDRHAILLPLSLGVAGFVTASAAFARGPMGVAVSLAVTIGVLLAISLLAAWLLEPRVAKGHTQN